MDLQDGRDVIQWAARVHMLRKGAHARLQRGASVDLAPCTPCTLLTRPECACTGGSLQGSNTVGHAVTLGRCRRTTSYSELKKEVCAGSSSDAKNRNRRTSYSCLATPGVMKYWILYSAATRHKQDVGFEACRCAKREAAGW